MALSNQSRTEISRDALRDAELDYKEAAAALRKAETVAEQARRALMVSLATDALEELAKISPAETFQTVISTLEDAVVKARNEAKGQPA